MLQERIELSTSPLPRECSTTELLQPERGASKERALLAQAAPVGKRRWRATSFRSRAFDRAAVLGHFRAGEVHEGSDAGRATQVRMGEDP